MSLNPDDCELAAIYRIPVSAFAAWLMSDLPQPKPTPKEDDKQ